MALLLNAQSVTKAFGATPLFREISFAVNEGDRVGVIGPNGSGKSTLLRMLAGEIEPDAGEVTLRSGARMVYIEQESQFGPGETVRSVVEAALRRAKAPEDEWETRLRATLGKAGFADFDTEAVTLSGGWKKRLAIAQGLVQNPDLLLLDEPTNHLDLAGIAWLEEVIRQSQFATVAISHDRYFLENFAKEIAELSRAYPSGLLRAKGTYSDFLEAKEAYLAAETKRQESLENRVRVEKEWLRRGPKARATKAKARIDRANELIGELADLSGRLKTASAGIDFTATDRQTKRLVEMEGVQYSADGRVLFENLNFPVVAGARVGIVGPNGSGKTTLLRLIAGELEAERGKITRANALRITYFEQNRRLDGEQTLRRALAPDSDSVVYGDRVIHVASWASRFLFTGEQLNQPVERLSGGERARVLLARLMLQPADLLILDEPTNDLDIPTLEILEESLLEYPGAVLLVTHDRYLLDRVSSVVIGLDGQGHAASFADYAQWEQWMAEQEAARKAEQQARAAAARSESAQGAAAASVAAPAKKKLSYLEAREWAGIEDRIAEAEAELQRHKVALEDASVATDAGRLQETLTQMESAQQAVDALYARWAELEAKQA
ncbi:MULTISPECIES: ABC-F family ATP-binding cassette domain-containing protein [Acidobacterium]|uniref:ABC transporter, (Putative) drug resistance ATPase (Drug RA) family, ATP-binding protein n=1 Tax=Acidobacterium capsulatum (strain ATCC 51196 / DSM 11244 / BCRC 80197 / JCM 7670 / NBRC 15755 / NCIMB 13165 / 161) TaxID=240015 RepID=C1F9X0_ACIC5|nr:MULTISPECIES: ABC-F family ATP-binding cassette domain-containing protein [Acidobacterium]ACO33293.1 ABC transporter, (putative) drug resistance ATPase (Drug RA) family, ATP-binding protein [Acidobacterium capsulatum ATCC 51196]HCT62106.1 ABC transporter ATP-binding protein [Acidobacterium sp.]